MITATLIEIRDRGTLIPACFVALSGSDHPLTHRAGFGTTEPTVVLIRLDVVEARSDPFRWVLGRTMREAHLWLREHWRSVRDGDVIDVEYVLGETRLPKKTEA